MPSTSAEGTPIAKDSSRLGKLNSWLGRMSAGKGVHALLVAAILAFTLLARAELVSRGGQNFFYDEAKFSTAREAAQIMAKGRVRDALVYTIQPHEAVYADHV